ncbi:MAG: hypothetical protein U9O54_01480 [Chloroflexota bacterium]|nr:hypothetical protein [Chloroflexota bacterium]
MTIRELLKLIEGKAITENVDLDQEVNMGCGSDLMSDVLAFTHTGTVLMSGLTNPQVVRTAEIAGIRAIIFVRGKYPPQKTIRRVAIASYEAEINLVLWGKGGMSAT